MHNAIEQLVDFLADSAPDDLTPERLAIAERTSDEHSATIALAAAEHVARFDTSPEGVRIRELCRHHLAGADVAADALEARRTLQLVERALTLSDAATLAAGPRERALSALYASYAALGAIFDMPPRAVVDDDPASSWAVSAVWAAWQTIEEPGSSSPVVELFAAILAAVEPLLPPAQPALTIVR